MELAYAVRIDDAPQMKASTMKPESKGLKIVPFLPMQRAMWCHIYAALFSIGVLTPCLIMLLDRRQPLQLEITSIEPNIGRVGDELTVNYDAVINRNGCGGELLRVIIDSANHVSAFVREPTIFNNRSMGKPGERIHFSKTLIIPRGVTPGTAVYAPLIDRWCNPLQRYLWPIQQDPPPRGTFTMLE